MSDFKMNNRTAVVVTPKQPFVDWLNNIPDPDFKIKGEPYTLEGAAGHQTVYLIPNLAHTPDLEEYFHKFKQQVFEDQLDGWYGDESTWPQARGPKAFAQWFHFQVDCMVFDLAENDEPLEQED